ncbi:MAG: hypothetical protein ACRDRU_16965 [Pseudonocardiaceae bacterium]
MTTSSARGTLVCNRIGDGSAAPSVVRECHCGAQLWVTTLMLPLVESGELTPVCAPCGTREGRQIDIHPRTMEVLIRRDQVAEAWQVVNALNAGILGGPSMNVPDRNGDQAPTHPGGSEP